MAVSSPPFVNSLCADLTTDWNFGEHFKPKALD